MTTERDGPMRGKERTMHHKWSRSPDRRSDSVDDLGSRWLRGLCLPAVEKLCFFPKNRSCTEEECCRLFFLPAAYFAGGDPSLLWWAADSSPRRPTIADYFQKGDHCTLWWAPTISPRLEILICVVAPSGGPQGHSSLRDCTGRGHIGWEPGEVVP